MSRFWNRGKASLWQAVWGTELGKLPPWRSRLIRSVHQLHLAVRELTAGQLMLRAEDPMIIALKDIVDGARIAGENIYLNPHSLPSDPRIDALLREIAQATAAALGNRTLSIPAPRAAQVFCKKRG